MAGIYNRDNIQYAPMIQNAIANAKETGATRAKYSKNQYDIAADLARAGARTAEGYFSDDPDRAGWASYIMSGDRSALEAARARAQQKAAQDAQFAQQAAMQKAQEKFQKEQAAKNFGQQLIMNEINAQNALKLANIQKETQAAYNRDEWQKQADLAGSDYTYARAAYMKDPSEENRMRLSRAEANVLYWNNKLGDDLINPSKDLPSVDEVSGTTGYDMDEAESNLKKLFEGDWTNKKRNRALEIIASMPKENKAKIEEWTTAVEAKKSTKEENEAAYQKELKAAGNNAARRREVKEKYGRE